MLDGKDGVAACLLRDFQEVELAIGETATQWGIAWPCTFDLQRRRFVVSERATGRIRAIEGYPTTELRRHLLMARNWRSRPG